MTPRQRQARELQKKLEPLSDANLGALTRVAIGTVIEAGPRGHATDLRGFLQILSNLVHSGIRSQSMMHKDFDTVNG